MHEVVGVSIRGAPRLGRYCSRLQLQRGPGREAAAAGEASLPSVDHLAHPAAHQPASPDTFFTLA